MNGSFVAGALGFVGIVLMSIAGFVITDYDLAKIVFVVAIAVIIVGLLFEIVERGFWK